MPSLFLHLAKGSEGSDVGFRAFPYPEHLLNTIFLERVKFNLVFPSYKYKDRAGWMELGGRQEVLPSHHTKEIDPDGHWKVMGLSHPIKFCPFSEAQTNQIKPSLTPGSWTPLISVLSSLPSSFPSLFFLSFLEQIDTEHLLCAKAVLVAGNIAVNKRDHVLVFKF